MRKSVRELLSMSFVLIVMFSCTEPTEGDLDRIIGSWKPLDDTILAVTTVSEDTFYPNFTLPTIGAIQIIGSPSTPLIYMNVSPDWGNQIYLKNVATDDVNSYPQFRLFYSLNESRLNYLELRHYLDETTQNIYSCDITENPFSLEDYTIALDSVAVYRWLQGSELIDSTDYLILDGHASNELTPLIAGIPIQIQTLRAGGIG